MKGYGLGDLPGLPLSGGIMTGPILAPNGTAAAPSYSFSADAASGWFLRASNVVGLSINGTQEIDLSPSLIRFQSSMVLSWSDGVALSTADVKLVRDAAAVLALKNGTTAQEFRVYNTISGANGDYGFFGARANTIYLGSEASGSGTARDLSLVTGGSSRLTISANGTTWTIATATSITLPDACNIALNTTTGTKIGTATTQKLGFFNATPVVQATTIVDADGTLADITTKFNSLLSKLETFGLLASA